MAGWLVNFQYYLKFCFTICIAEYKMKVDRKSYHILTSFRKDAFYAKFYYFLILKALVLHQLVQVCTEMVMQMCSSGLPNDFFQENCPFTVQGLFHPNFFLQLFISFAFFKSTDILKQKILKYFIFEIFYFSFFFITVHNFHNFINQQRSLMVLSQGFQFKKIFCQF